MFQWQTDHLKVDDAIREVKRRKGLIPIDIEMKNQRLVWLDMGKYHLDDSFFFVSTRKRLQQDEEICAFTSDLSLLDCDEILDEFIYPTGFIFHVGRCGSTLLARALARLPHHLVISEAPPHFLIWEFLNTNWSIPIAHTDQNRRRYRNLILVIGRKRRPEYRAHFVKFTTHNVLFLDFIRAVFPDVPALFLYRDPAEVLVAFADQGPGWEHLKNTEFGAFVAGSSIEEVKVMSRGSFHEHFLSRFMTAPLQAPADSITVANYAHLNRKRLPTFLQALNYFASADELVRMQKQFDYYSKADSEEVKFSSDTVKKRRAVTPEIEALVQMRLSGLYERLETAENNLFRSFQAG
jgi:hypothetical protein